AAYVLEDLKLQNLVGTAVLADLHRTVAAVTKMLGTLDDRRTRQLSGISQAKTDGRYTGRKPNLARHALLRSMLDAGVSWSDVCTITGSSRSTLARIRRAEQVSAILK
ncbi:helix-turn-helix domain-containing protein, partial [Roseateles sp.]|uniref:helix-turn-helix domain-containing protein n=1 Tax=Roseateles sp. TaxID=1971397 RepID=UPI00286A3E36